MFYLKKYRKYLNTFEKNGTNIKLMKKPNKDDHSVFANMDYTAKIQNMQNLFSSTVSSSIQFASSLVFEKFDKATQSMSL